MRSFVSLTLVAKLLLVQLVPQEERAIAGFLVRHGGPESRAPDVAALVAETAREWAVDVALIAAVITVENPWLKSDTLSHAGAIGLMQVMPFWTEHLSSRCGDNLTDDRTNLCYGANIIRIFLDRERGDLESALLAYNGCKTLERCGHYPSLVLGRRDRLAARIEAQARHD